MCVIVGCVSPQRKVCVRWNSGSDGGGEEKRKEQRRAGFIENFLNNIQQGLKRNKEMQESLKGLREERERMQKSYVLQRWKEQVEEGWEKVKEGGSKGWEVVRQGWWKARDGLSKVCIASACALLHVNLASYVMYRQHQEWVIVN